jgi:uncharacterized membrane protein
VLLGLKLLYRGVTGNSPIYRALGVNTAVNTRPDRVSVPHQQGIHIVRAVSIDRPVEELYAFWRDLVNLPHILNYVESVQPLDGNRSHWVLKLPAGLKAEFESEVYTDVPNEVISWRSLPGSAVQNAGSVRFRPSLGGSGTEVQLTVELVPPGGPPGKAILSLFGEAPQQYVAQMLREFKQVMETGEVATTDGQSSGRQQEAQA